MRSAVCLMIGCLATATAAESADRPATTPYESAPPKSAAPTTAPVTPAAALPQPDDFTSRQVRLQQQQAQQKAFEESNRPTAWQLQNPSNLQNRIPTDSNLPGYVSTNNYFGAQFREWSNMTGPVTQSQWPANMTPTVPLIQTNVMMAPRTYWGADSLRWSNVSTPPAQLNPLGGWTTHPGW